MEKNPVCEMLGIRYPVFQGGMAWIADAKLASAVSEAGGLGLIAAGVVGMATNVALNWEEIPNRVRETIGKIDLAVGAGLLAAGALLAFTGFNIPLGIGLMAAGLATGAAGVAINWDLITSNVTHVVETLGYILGGALLALGAVITFATPAFSPLGLGLMIAGAASLAGVAAVNWDYIAEKMRGTVGLITTIAGGALLAIGLVLVFTGVGLPLGLGLILAGGAALGVGATNYDWNALLDKIRGAWEGIKNWFNTNVAQYLKGSYWQAKINEAFGKISFPHINLPHFHLEWEQAPGAIASALDFFGLPASIPHIAVDWYARGGIVDGATLIGAGEDGKEAVVPLERHTEWIRMVADALVDRITSNNRLADFISGMPMPALVSGQVVPPRALSNSGSVFTDGDIQRLVSGLTAALSGDGGFGETTVKLYLDGRQIAENVSKHQRQMERGR